MGLTTSLDSSPYVKICALFRSSLLPSFLFVEGSNSTDLQSRGEEEMRRCVRSAGIQQGQMNASQAVPAFQIPAWNSLSHAPQTPAHLSSWFPSGWRGCLQTTLVVSTLCYPQPVPAHLRACARLFLGSKCPPSSLLRPRTP